MSLLQRYLSQAVLNALLLLFLVVVGVYFVISLLGELPEVGRGDYRLAQAVVYVLMTTPQNLYALFPVIALLASLLGLSALAHHNELIVMRASGMAITKIAFLLGQVMFVVVLLVSVGVESFAPSAKHFAETQKAIAKSGGQTIKTARGIWLHQKNAFVNIETVLSSDRLGQVNIYLFDDAQRLKKTISAKEGTRVSQHTWRLRDVLQSELSDTKIVSRKIVGMDWRLALQSDLLAIVKTQPAEMSLLQLYRYITVMERNKIKPAQYLFAFWHRLLAPIAVMVMILLAVPFVFGSVRHGTMGGRLLLGVFLGFAFYLANEIFGAVSIVYQLPPLLAAILPILLFAGIGVYLLKRPPH